MSSRKETPDVLGQVLSGGEQPPARPKTPKPSARPAARSPRGKKAAPSPVSAPGPSPVPAAWEYKEVVFREYRGWRVLAVDGQERAGWKDGALLLDYVSELGKAGWEMVSMSDEHRHEKTAYFKRPVEFSPAL